jgi:aryl-alcohol dehydrogenase-like predicted oxidoreductase
VIVALRVHCFSPLAQGLLTDRYLAGVPAGSRATEGDSFSLEMLSDTNLAKVRSLNETAVAGGSRSPRWHWHGLFANPR